MKNQALQPESAAADPAPPCPPAIRVAIVEDMQFMAEILERCCQKWRMQVIGPCHTGHDGYAAITQTKPDVALIDLCLPDMSGIDLIRKINEAAPAVRIIIASGSWRDYQVHRLRGVRFQGFVDKAVADLQRFRHAIELVALGGNYYSSRYLEAVRRMQESDAPFFKVLSEREQEVMILAAQALSNAEIALRLGLAPATVQTHRQKILHKLNLSSTAMLIRYGIALGLEYEAIPPTPPEAVGRKERTTRFPPAGG